MGQLIDGKWSTEWYDTKKTGGRFVRGQSGFRNWVTGDGSAGPSGEGGFAAEAGRYHLYVSLACPWAHRTLVFRKLKKLDLHHHFCSNDMMQRLQTLGIEVDVSEREEPDEWDGQEQRFVAVSE